MTAGHVLVSDDTVESAGMAVRGIESGRRVGWAKAFEAMRRADSAEYDLNIIRGDIVMLSNFAARAYGALEVSLGRDRICQLFRGDHHELQSWMPQGQLNKGRDDMRRLLGKFSDELSRLRAKIANAKTEHRWLHDKAYEAAKAEMLDELMAEFGIGSRDELYVWLAQHPKEVDGG